MMVECRKTRYEHEDEALGVLAAITVRGMQGDRRSPKGWWGHQPVGVYECPNCGGWHLTSQPRGDRIMNRKGGHG
jgi:hypothetical protein